MEGDERQDCDVDERRRGDTMKSWREEEVEEV